MAKKSDSAKKPKVGETTQGQGSTSAVGGDMMNGFGVAPVASYDTYRKMRANPTVALARMVAGAPVRAIEWGIVGDDVPDEVIEFVEKQIGDLWGVIAKDILLALDYGWSPFEKIWGVDRKGRWVVKKLKPLRVDKTKIVINKVTGVFEGLKQGGVVLPPEKCFLFSYDVEAGNLYGRSRHENIRGTAYRDWNEMEKKMGQYVTKIAGVIPMIEYPEGQSLDANGATKDNFDLAKDVLSNLGQGHGVAFPNIFSKLAPELSRAGVDMDSLKAWHISFLETKGSHGKEFVDNMRHMESLMMRGWLIPERVATEGQYGTKAESAAHADVAYLIARFLIDEVVMAMNWYLINPLVVYNFGEEMENRVKMVVRGVDSATMAWFRLMVEKIFTQTANVDLLLEAVDMDAMLSLAGVPKRDDGGDLKEVKEEEEPEPDEPEIVDSDDSKKKASMVGLLMDKLIGK